MPKNAIQKITNFADPKVKRFSPGDLAVYPVHGVGRIESVKCQEIEGQTQNFYFMNIFESNMIIMIPTKNAKSVGLRDVIRKKEIRKVYDILQSKDKSAMNNQSWGYRYKRYMNLIKSGSPYDIAQVFRDLYLIKLSKRLSFGEQKLFDMARSLLLKELCAVKNKNEKELMEEIQSLF